jgi:RNA polymerase sigma-70 factor, ECF subfamily
VMIGLQKHKQNSTKSMHRLSDEQLMMIYQTINDSRRHKAFDCLYERYSRPISNYFYFTLNNNSEKAQDFVHDLFLKIIENPTVFNPQYSFKGWIYRVASNMCKNEFRHIKTDLAFQQHQTSEAISESLFTDEERHLRHCISLLNQEHRALIVLRFRINLTIKEIAEIYECPEGTIKSRLFYATRELSTIYKNYENGK